MVLTGGDAGRSRPAGVVLAAGLGTRLRPLTDLRPKPLCPLGASTCLEVALGLLAPHCGSGPEQLAVNAFHLADQVAQEVGGRAWVSVEPELMGTAGALALLSDWRAGRDVLLLNGDAYLGDDPAALAPLLAGWNRDSVRMLVVPVAEHPDFAGPDLVVLGPGLGCGAAGWRYVGAVAMPGRLLTGLPVEPSGLFSRVWAPARAAGLVELVPHPGVAIDTGTPAGYLAANLHSSGGESVVGAGAVVRGRIHECVIWPGAVVGPQEHLVRSIRAGSATSPVTVHAD